MAMCCAALSIFYWGTHREQAERRAWVEQHGDVIQELVRDYEYQRATTHQDFPTLQAEP